MTAPAPTPTLTCPAGGTTGNTAEADRDQLLAALERIARGEQATGAEEDAAIASGLLPGEYGDAHAIAAATVTTARECVP